MHQQSKLWNASTVLFLVHLEILPVSQNNEVTPSFPSSGGSRRGSMGSMEPFFWRAAFENTKYTRTIYTYSSLTLELRTSALTVAIPHVCQLLYQEFDVHMAYVHVYTTRSMWQLQRQWAKRPSELKFIHALLPLQLGMAIYAISKRVLMWITTCFAASTARSGVMPLIPLASNTKTRFSSRSSNDYNLRRSEIQVSWGSMP